MSDPATTPIPPHPFYPRRPPWDAGQDNAWDVFAAWRAWFSAALDDNLPDDAPPILDGLDGVQEAYLYNVMSRLAAGEWDRPEDRPEGA